MSDTHYNPTVNSIDLAKDIEHLFNLELRSLYALPVATQLAIVAKARQHDLTRIAQRTARIKAVLARWDALPYEQLREGTDQLSPSEYEYARETGLINYEPAYGLINWNSEVQHVG